MSLELRTYPDPSLRVGCDPVTQGFGDPLRRLVDEMLSAMRIRDGVGLAAPQVGLGPRIFVARPSMVFVNPKIVGRSGKATAPEGCLSLPGVLRLVTRYTRVMVESLDVDGHPFRV